VGAAEVEAAVRCRYKFMAQEISREFKPGEGVVAVVIRDEFGSEQHHSVRVLIVDKCPTCGHQNVVTGGVVDVEATVQAHIADTDKITALKVDGFAAAGMDVTLQRTALLAHTTSKSL
jgi:hypothetical protein